MATLLEPQQMAEKQFEKLLQLCQQGQSRSILLTGEAGCGKTQFALQNVNQFLASQSGILVSLRLPVCGLTLAALNQKINHSLTTWAETVLEKTLEEINAQLNPYDQHWDRNDLLDILALSQQQSLQADQLEKLIGNQITQKWHFIKKLIQQPKSSCAFVAQAINKPLLQMAFQILNPLNQMQTDNDLKNWETLHQLLEKLSKQQVLPVILLFDQFERVNQLPEEEALKVKQAILQQIKHQATQRQSYVQWLVVCQSEAESKTLTDGLFWQLKQKILLPWVYQPKSSFEIEPIDQNLILQNLTKIQLAFSDGPILKQHLTQILSEPIIQQLLQQQLISTIKVLDKLTEQTYCVETQKFVDLINQTQMANTSSAIIGTAETTLITREQFDEKINAITPETAFAIGLQFANSPDCFDLAKAICEQRLQTGLMKLEHQQQTSVTGTDAWAYFIALSQLDAQLAFEKLIEGLGYLSSDQELTLNQVLTSQWPIQSGLPYPEVIWEKLKPHLTSNLRYLNWLPLLVRFGFKSHQLESIVEPLLAEYATKTSDEDLAVLTQIMELTTNLNTINQGIERQLLALIAFQKQPSVLILALQQLKRLPLEKQLGVMRELTQHPNQDIQLKAFMQLSSLDSQETLGTWVEPLIVTPNLDEKLETVLVQYLAKNNNQQAQSLLLQYLNINRKPWLVFRAVQGLAYNSKSKKAISTLKELQSNYPLNGLVSLAIEKAITTLEKRLGQEDSNRQVYQPKSDDPIIDLVSNN